VFVKVGKRLNTNTKHTNSNDHAHNHTRDTRIAMLGLYLQAE